MSIDVPRDKPDLERISRAAARAVYLGERQLLAVVLGKIKMILDSTDRGITPHLALDGFWESWVTLAMMQLARPGMHVVNIGANMGYYALIFAELVGPTGWTIAIEPNRQLCDLIRQSKGLNGLDHLGVLECAVADRTGTSTLIVPARNCGWGQIEECSTHPEATDIQNVRVATLDDLMAPHVVPVSTWTGDIDIVFIDAEGAEERIWLGAAVTRQRVHRWVIEYSPDRYRDPEGFARGFIDAGYALGKITEDGTMMPTTPEALAMGREVMVTLVRLPKKEGARP